MRSMASDVARRKREERTGSSYTAGNPIMQDIGTFRKRKQAVSDAKSDTDKGKDSVTSER
jgi:hypothetical protein